MREGNRHISQWRWREIKAVLMQYEDRKRKIADIIHLPAGISGDGSRSSGGADPTQQQALLISRYQSINDQIDRACSKFPQGEILRKCFGYDKAVKLGYAGCKSVYYKDKRAFFAELDKVI